MKKLLILLLSLAFWSCDNDDDFMASSSPIDLSSCFSPEFGTIEREQFFFDIEPGELQVNIDSIITSQNVGYSIQQGSNLVFVYRHFLENSFSIDDDEVEIRILFQVDENLNSFSISSAEDFEKSNCVYAQCGSAFQSISGFINGNKNSDGNWSINAEIKIDRTTNVKEVQINETFIL